MLSLRSWLRGLVDAVRETFAKVIRTFEIPEEFVSVPTAVSAAVDAALFEARDTIDATIGFKTCYIERYLYSGEDTNFVPPGNRQWGGRVVALLPDGRIMYVDRRLPKGAVYDEWKIVSLALDDIIKEAGLPPLTPSKVARDMVLEVIPFQEEIIRL